MVNSALDSIYGLTFDLTQIRPRPILVSMARGVYWRASVTDTGWWWDMFDLCAALIIINRCSLLILVNHHNHHDGKCGDRKLDFCHYSIHEKQLYCGPDMICLVDDPDEGRKPKLLCAAGILFKMWTLLSIKVFKSQKVQQHQAADFGSKDVHCVHSCVGPRKNRLLAHSTMPVNQFLLKFSQLSVDSNLCL